MGSTRQTLDALAGNLQESMGVRKTEFEPTLAPVPGKRDVGRRPLRNVGKLAISQVVPDPSQPRIEFAEDAIERLAMSIREKGQLSPIRVRWSEELGKWVIIAGERRWRAVRHAGLAEIECCFHETDLTASEILEQQLIENCLREDLQPIEEAKAFAALMDLNGWNGKQVAEALRVHPSRVSRALSLLKLPGNVQEKVTLGDISARSAYEISKISNSEAQLKVAERAAAGKMTVGQTVKAVRQRRGKEKPPPRSTKLTFQGSDNWKVIVSCQRKGSYFEVEQALLLALEEVRHRIDSGCQVF